jgi:PKD repeat protein
VTLTVTDNDNAPSAPVAQDVTVTEAPNEAPTASFSSTTSDLTASFTDTSTDTDGTITGWSWNFGDGNTSTLQNPTHTYAAAGTYSVTLTVTDNDNAPSDPVAQDVTVTEGLSLAGISPNEVAAGASVDDVEITGTGFIAEAVVSFENGTGPAPDATVVSVTATAIKVSVTAKSGGPARDRVWSVRVTNPDGSSAVLPGAFTVTAAR